MNGIFISFEICRASLQESCWFWAVARSELHTGSTIQVEFLGQLCAFCIVMYSARSSPLGRTPTYYKMTEAQLQQEQKPCSKADAQRF